MRLVLASASPRRADLLRAAGFDFDVAPVNVDESPRAGEHPREYVERLAGAKALEAASRDPDAVVIAADTAVVIDDTILGKPVDDRDAVLMLRKLSGRTHQVMTGICVGRSGRLECVVECTRVQFRVLAPADIDAYVATSEGRDKAGAYAIQGLAGGFVERIEGSRSNVIGLPIESVRRLLGSHES
jgi:septum formation protein